MPSPRYGSPADLAAAVRDGDARAVARLITLVEDGSPRLREVMALLPVDAADAQVVGLTGPPGVGKSTTAAALVTAYRERGLRVGVLTVDPSSQRSGGALLGDRVRMQEHALDPGVYVRSMASRGHPGGLSSATPQAVRVLAASGCAVVLVETAGAGPADVDVARLVDTTVVLLAPGMGDGVQAAKAGILEVADVLVVNHADRDGADATARALRQMLGMTPVEEGGWRTPVVRTVASRQEGLAEVLEAVSAHARWLADTGAGQRRRVARAGAEIEQLASTELRRQLGDPLGAGLDAARLGVLAAAVVAGGTDPYAAADELLEAVRGQ